MVVVGNSVTRVTHLVQTQNLRGFSLEKKNYALRKYQILIFPYILGRDKKKKNFFSKGKKFLLLAGKK